MKSSHHINSAPIYLTINAQPWIPVETKARLLEWKIRYDIIQYAGRAVPALPLDELKAYQPKNSMKASLPGKIFVSPNILPQVIERHLLIKCLFTRPDIMTRLHDLALTPHDDGHAVKLSRAAVITQQLSEKYSDRDWLVIKGDDLWMRIHHLIADSVEAPGPMWIRTAGVDAAWNVSTHHALGLLRAPSSSVLTCAGRTFPRNPNCDTSCNRD